jgi:hypothetical protein
MNTYTKTQGGWDIKLVTIGSAKSTESSAALVVASCPHGKNFFLHVS